MYKYRIVLLLIPVFVFRDFLALITSLVKNFTHSLSFLCYVVPPLRYCFHAALFHFQFHVIIPPH